LLHPTINRHFSDKLHILKPVQSIFLFMFCVLFSRC
jgi:hypothetical protein